jgi:hypothetical protein
MRATRNAHPLVTTTYSLLVLIRIYKAYAVTLQSLRVYVYVSLSVHDPKFLLCPPQHFLVFCAAHVVLKESR